MLQWYTLYTKLRAEKHVSEVLQAQNLETYLPMIQVWRARRRRMEEEPFFPRYLFARLNLETLGISKVAWTPGLLYIIGADDRPTPVSDAVIIHIRRRLGDMDPQGPLALQPGEPVRLMEGPLKDLEAVFEKYLSGYERAEILIRVLGRLTHYHVPANWLARS
jgi:transcriptional antiterminator RfaH